MRSYPAVLIGRLGVSTKFKKQGIGTELLDFIKLWFIDENNKTGCRFIVVDAYNDECVLNFYKKNGFVFMFSTEEQEKNYLKVKTDYKLHTRFLYFDLVLIR
jgi:GNAT superfamily N-acetyltransferase